MTPVVVGLLLLAALLHASWNAFLRSGKDRLWTVVVMCTMAAAVSLAAVFVLPKPGISSWPFIGLSALLEITYCLLLVTAYEHGELAHVYPLARGVSPLLVTVGAMAFAHETPSAMTWIGVVLVSSGILSLSAAQDRQGFGPTLFALATGVVVASFTLLDGVGVRLSGQPQSYAAWLFLLQGAPMPFIYVIARKRLWPAIHFRETGRAMTAGLVSMTAYALVLWALNLGSIGPVAALRETSILFALVIGRVLLGERVMARRVASAATIAVGAFVLAARG